MKVGDLVKLAPGARDVWGLPTGVALLVEKMPRNDRLEYDWRVFVDGRSIELGRQMERYLEVVNESR